MRDTERPEKVSRLALGIAEAARSIGCSPGHIRNLIERGELRSTRVGRRRLVPTQALVDYLNNDTDLAEAFGPNDNNQEAA